VLYAPNLSSYPKSTEIDAFYPDNNLTLTLFQKNAGDNNGYTARKTQ
jgi:hypothetical protein